MKELIELDEKKCTVCLACVRSCPVKAIKMGSENRPPKVIHDRCIGCGVCITSCSFDAIKCKESKKETIQILNTSKNTLALIDPAISAEFDDITDYRKFVQMLKTLGFKYVNEVAFGVDIIARKYFELFGDFRGLYYISSNDPVVVSYIEKYHPELLNNLAPLVSPMIASAMIMRQKHGKDLKTVYIGPNIASKVEADEYKGEGKVDAVLTFIELRELFAQFNITESNLEFSEFDAPTGFKGTLYPLANGLIQAADINENILTSSVLSIEGSHEMIEAISEFEKSAEKIERHLNISFGNSLAGAGMSPGAKKLKKQSLVINFANKRLHSFYRREWDDNLRIFGGLDYSRKFKNDDQRLPIPKKEKIDSVLKTIEVTNENANNGCGACGYNSCREFAISVAQGLTTPEMCITYTRRNQHDYIESLKATNEKLANMQQALQESQKKAQQERDMANEASEIITGMLHKLRAGVVIIDNTLKVVHSNETFINLLGDDAREINEVIPGLKGADLKALLPYNFYNLFTYVLNNNEDIPNKDVQYDEKLLNVSLFTIKPRKIVGAVVRDMHLPQVQKDEVISRVTDVVDRNLEMVQKIGFLLGEGASETEKMLNSIIESFRSTEAKKEKK